MFPKGTTVYPVQKGQSAEAAPCSTQYFETDLPPHAPSKKGELVDLESIENFKDIPGMLGDIRAPVRPRVAGAVEPSVVPGQNAAIRVECRGKGAQRGNGSTEPVGENEGEGGAVFASRTTIEVAEGDAVTGGHGSRLKVKRDAHGSGFAVISFLPTRKRTGSVRRIQRPFFAENFLLRETSMSEDNKPKIDLKARLGKKTVTGVGPSIPPPMVGGPAVRPPGSIPAPALGQPAPSPSQAPRPSQAPPAARPSQPAAAPSPFAAQAPSPFGPPSQAPSPFGTPSQAPSPFGAASPSPFGAPAATAPRPAQPQAIRIEMGEEVLAAQKKDRSKYALIAVVTALVGGFLGSVVGGGMERRKQHNIALEGSSILAQEVDKANLEIEKLADILKAAKLSLSEGKYPTDQIQALGATNIPFDGTYLVGKGIGLLSTDINRLLVKFAGDTERANQQKDSLQRLFSAMREPVTELLAEQEAPKFRWGVYVERGAQGPVASMQPLPSPFLVTSKESGYKWPDNFEVPDGQKKVKLDRYTKGDPVSETPQVIPVNPGTQTLVCPSDTLVRLSRELGELESTLRGDKSDPINERMGLVDTGTVLREKLKTLGQ